MVCGDLAVIIMGEKKLYNLDSPRVQTLTNTDWWINWNSVRNQEWIESGVQLHCKQGFLIDTQDKTHLPEAYLCREVCSGTVFGYL